MHIEDFICDALDMVSAWDLPEEDFAQAVNDQARADYYSFLLRP